MIVIDFSVTDTTVSAGALLVARRRRLKAAYLLAGRQWSALLFTFAASCFASSGFAFANSFKANYSDYRSVDRSASEQDGPESARWPPVCERTRNCLL